VEAEVAIAVVVVVAHQNLAGGEAAGEGATGEAAAEMV
jgi:hypothetical protein